MSAIRELRQEQRKADQAIETLAEIQDLIKHPDIDDPAWILEQLKGVLEEHGVEGILAAHGY